MNTIPQISPDGPLNASTEQKAQGVDRAPTPKPKREAPAATKTDIVLKKLRSSKGATIQQLSDATGWQMHSVRGFLSATVRKKLSLNLVSDVGKDDIRRYRIVNIASGATS